MNKKIFNLSIRDFGPGLNEVTIDKIFTYGGSSKRDDVEATGCLGLGAKSPYGIIDQINQRIQSNWILLKKMVWR